MYAYLRLLYASIGVPHCPNCGREISRQSAAQIAERVLALNPGGTQDLRVTILAPVVRGRKGEFRKELESFAQQGFARARIDGETVQLDFGDDEQPTKLDKRKNHTIDVV